MNLASKRAHVFTVDLEEYFQVSAFGVPVDQWDSHPSRVEASADLLLEELSKYSVHATFFTLGWIARRHSSLLRRIAEAGHEVASHGFAHQRVTALAPEQFRHDVRESKRIIEDVIGRPVRGHRAPSFSVIPGVEWALDVLIEEGYVYDSSLFPIRRVGYGYPGATPVPHLIRRDRGTLLELPMATTTWGGLRLPAAGGAYLRILPFGLTHKAFREHTRDGECAVFYMHPWELDLDQPRLPVSPFARFRHYGGLRKTLPRLRKLLDDFRFTSIERRFEFDSLGRDAMVRPAMA
jgi:polysaccharide deacetylase family protein (PEP-CTERM system associated)